MQIYNALKATVIRRRDNIPLRIEIYHNSFVNITTHFGFKFREAS